MAKIKPVKVFNMRGEEIEPTTQKKAKDLLKQSKAYIIAREPFSIQLKMASGEKS